MHSPIELDTARQLFQQGQWAEAERHCRDLLAAREECPETWLLLGNALQGQGRHEEAILCLDQALHWRPAYIKAQLNRAASLACLNRLDDAKKAYQDVLANDATSLNARLGLTSVLLGMGHAENACEILLEAMDSRSEEHPEWIRQLGYCLAALAATRGIDTRIFYPSERAGAHRGFFRRHHLPAPPPDLPLVSIVAPSYNYGRYIAETLNSVRRQTYPNLELIVIDDGSRDDSVAIIRETLADFPFPHRVIARENRGPVATVNEGVELAQGHYVAILETDDRYHPNRIEYMVRMLNTPGARWGFSGVAFMDADGNRLCLGGDDPVVTDRMIYNHDTLYQLRAISEGILIWTYPQTSGNLVFEKSLWQEIGGFKPSRYSWDFSFCLDAMPLAEPLFFDEPLYEYRLHGSNTHQQNLERMKAEYRQYLAAWYPRLEQMAAIPNPHFARFQTEKLDYLLMGRGDAEFMGLPKLLEHARRLGLESTRTPASQGTPDTEHHEQPAPPHGLQSSTVASATEQNPCIVGIVAVQNDADQMEEFLLEGLRYLDHWLIGVHPSLDGTPAILERLMAEGQPVTVTKLREPIAYEHGQVINELFQLAIERHAPDWVIPLNPGDFNDLLDRDMLVAALGPFPGAHVALPWISLDDPTIADDLETAGEVLPESLEITQYKLAVNAALLGPYIDRYAIEPDTQCIVFRGTPTASSQPMQALQLVNPALS